MHKDRLEKYMIDHREEFDNLVPDPGLWEKIDKDLDVKETKIRRISATKIFWRVAAVVVIFVASYFFHDLMSRRGEHLAEKQVEIEADNEVLKLLDEAEAFYASRINEMKELVFQYAMDNPGIEEELELELSQLDSVYTELRKDLKDNAANEQVVEAMIQNYRIKLEILEDILHQLKKNEENMNVETHEI